MRREKKIAGELNFTQQTWTAPELPSGVDRELCVKDSAITSKWYEENLLDQKCPGTFVRNFNQCTTHYILPFATASLVAAFVVCLKAFHSSTLRGFVPLFTDPALLKTI
jgi:hypothetical protein